MATIDEIKQKYQIDKRQTGQLFTRGNGRGGDFRKSNIKDPEDLKEFKQEKRAKAAGMPGPDDIAKRNQELRKAKSEILNAVRKFEGQVKNATSGRQILTSFDYLKVEITRAATTYDWKRETGRIK